MWRSVVLLLLVVGAGSPVLGCDWLEHFTHRTNACLEKLREMEGPVRPSHEALPSIGRFSALYSSALRQKGASQLAFVQDNLRHIMDLYRHGNLSRLDWDVQPFVTTLYSQILRLQSCVSEPVSEDSALSRYYRRLQRHTERHNGSLASWKQMNQVTRLLLHRLNAMVLSVRDRHREGPEPTTTERRGPERSTAGRRKTLTTRGCCNN